MTDSTLKCVVVLDPETQGYKPAAHNLAASAAVELAEQLAGEDRKAKILDQSERHRTSDPAKCGRCKRAAETMAANGDDHPQPVEPVAS
jgi:hypothetical protein